MKRGFIYLSFLLIFLLLFRTFLFSSYVVEGRSMEPALHDGDRAVVSVMGDLLQPLESRDMIFFRMNEETFVKRVLAVPGDYLAVHHRYLYVNGERYSDTKADYQELLNISESNGQVVPEKCYIVLGDNLQESADSRTYGCIAENDIIGKVIGHFDLKFNE
ncbi:signal peptidase I [Macrococcus carouselicus]|uniref:Signal peptidase I n=1 Tax=Macrococcus carouselicus TaxID=69969 RepID=A0A9Q8FQB4_9STAP|nr:signal peptidase I [Macrococcus carouselicus]TDM03773.1 signal peptidase I [Macrococcus carouselicus]